MNRYSGIEFEVEYGFVTVGTPTEHRAGTKAGEGEGEVYNYVVSNSKPPAASMCYNAIISSSVK